MVKVTNSKKYFFLMMIINYLFFLPNSYYIRLMIVMNFPMEIDLEEFLSENADRSNPHKYLLHGLVYNFTLITALSTIFKLFKIVNLFLLYSVR